MSKKEEKKDDKGAKDKAAKEPATPEQEAASAKKKKLMLFGVVGLLVIGGGAFAAMKMLGSSSKATHEPPAGATEDGASKDGHAEGEGGEAKGGAHGEAKGDAHGGSDGEAQKQGGGHGDKKEAGGHGEKKDEGGHGDKKEAGGHGESPSGEPGKEGGTAEGDSRYAGIGIMYDFKPFHLNLGNPLENRYVRMEIRLEYPNVEQKTELTARDSQLRDAIVTIISRKTREHLLSPDGKDQLRLEIKNRLNQYLEKKIVNVYITDILIE
jgi:flagellar FliL protein